MPALENRVALVTGGARGIGHGIVLEMAREGADIAIGDIDLTEAEKTAAEVRNVGRQCSIIELDVNMVVFSVSRRVDCPYSCHAKMTEPSATVVKAD